MYKLLLAGFDPFAHYQKNPAWEAVKALPDTVANVAITKLMMPNIYGLDARVVLEKAQEVEPDIILMLGMNSGSTKINIDIAALNIRDALIEDNLGRKPWNEPVVATGPAAYFATIPTHELWEYLKGWGHEVQLSYGAGGFVCNDVFYLVSHHYAGTAVRVGFMHLPILPSMTLDETMARSLEDDLVALQDAIEFLGKWLDRGAGAADLILDF